MSNFLSDYLNDRLEPVATGGLVNGVFDYGLPDSVEQHESDPESDTEQQEYVRRELSTYFPEEQEEGGLTDIIDGREESILGSEFCQQLNIPKVFDVYKFDTYYKRDLPIDSFKQKILALISTNSVVIIHGPTGCGKTTQVPQHILDECKANKTPCNIVVTQPRRIAAINIAHRVNEERGWALGTVCGYQVGLDKKVGEDVILTYVTTEVLLQKLILQKNLNRYTHIIIDEVHERSKTLDFLLLIVRKYLFTNSPTVKIILMSATMEAQEFAYYFRSISRSNFEEYLLAPILHVNKKSEYTTNIYYIEQFTSSRPIYNLDEPGIGPEQYEMCMKLIWIFDNLDDTDLETGQKKLGSVLVFLPGFHEIESMSKILEKERNFQWEIIPLHSQLSTEHMGKAFQKPKPNMRKIILSTNIAESSVTVPDVTYVIDFCLTKIMVTNESTKFSCLSLEWASHNNCIQRAGRVGRVANGRVYRLVPAEFYDTQMQPNITPELQRAPLENVILYMKLLELNDTPKNVLSLAISPPNLKDVESCIWHLKEVGALLQTTRGIVSAADGDLTFIGRVMGSLPIDIHLSKLVLLGHMFSCLDETIIMAAGCMTRNLFVSNFRDRFKCYRKKLLWADGSCSDFMVLLNLYNVWLRAKRENTFRSVNEEVAWCKTNFINLKGLREWEMLIREINARLKKLNIEKTMGPERAQLDAVEKPTVLKVIICGAFYPNFFIRSSEFGQVDSREAARTLNGRDPFNTVYFTNMKLHQPGQIYVRKIKKLMNAENNPNVQIGFDGQSSKVFVEFKNVKQPEKVEVDGRQYIATIPGNIATDVYEAVRKRQLNVPFQLDILPDHKAWAFVKEKEGAMMRQISSSSSDDFNCFSEVEYSALPSLDTEYMTVIISHIVDVSHFYCQHWNEETRMLLDRIYMALNGPGVFLEALQLGAKVEVHKTVYAAMFQEDGKFYRCQVLYVEAGQLPYANVKFIDYGNQQRVPVNRLYYLPDVQESKVGPIAMCCMLSEIQPDKLNNPSGIWTEKVNAIFRKKTEKVLLNAKVYSVVDNVVHLELYPHSSNHLSFNQYLINANYAQKSIESHMSRTDHEKRQQILRSENPVDINIFKSEMTANTNYTDFDEPAASEATEAIVLKGPHSPLEMKVCGLVQASAGAAVRVEGESVNAVLLDDNPDDPHARLLVAGQVTQTAMGKCVKLTQTMIMPSIPGLPLLMTLLFCPKMEPKLLADGSRVAGVLCGLGSKENGRANFPMHDISLVLDTELTADIFLKVNEVRYHMNQAVRSMSNIYDEIEFPLKLVRTQRKLKELLFELLHMKKKSVDRINVKYADVWNKNMCDVEVMKVNQDDEEDDIWRLLWFVDLKADRYPRIDINKNLEELNQIAKRLAPEREITCQLCNSDPLVTIGDVRIHLFRDGHKTKLATFNQDIH